MKKLIILIPFLFFSCDGLQNEPDCAGILGGNSVCGCMDNSAVNYEPNAVYDDSSCAYAIVRMIWESSGSEDTYFEIHKENFQFVITVVKFDGDSVNVVGYVGQSELEIYSTLNGIFTGYYNLIDFSTPPGGAPTGLSTTITLVYETGLTQSYDSTFPDDPIDDIYDFVGINANGWCSENYYSIENVCFYEGDMELLQELVGNFAPSVLVTMEEPEWENGRLVNFHCQGCILENTLPDSLGNLTELRELLISNTLLTGGLPGSLFSLEHLEVLVLSSNQLNSTIPESICNLDIENMVLELENNQFCPPFPECIEQYIGDQDTTQCDDG